jgi:hypothetical protein
VQSQLSQFIAGLGPIVLTLIAAMLVAGIAVLALGGRRRRVSR